MAAVNGAVVLLLVVWVAVLVGERIAASPPYSRERGR